MRGLDLRRDRPNGVLLVHWTHRRWEDRTARAMARYLFGSDDGCCVSTCASTRAVPVSKILGAPPGYSASSTARPFLRSSREAFRRRPAGRDREGALGGASPVPAGFRGWLPDHLPRSGSTSRRGDRNDGEHRSAAVGRSGFGRRASPCRDWATRRPLPARVREPHRRDLRVPAISTSDDVKRILPDVTLPGWLEANEEARRGPQPQR